MTGADDDGRDLDLDLADLLDAEPPPDSFWQAVVDQAVASTPAEADGSLVPRPDDDGEEGRPDDPDAGAGDGWPAHEVGTGGPGHLDTADDHPVVDPDHHDGADDHHDEPGWAGDGHLDDDHGGWS